MLLRYNLKKIYKSKLIISPRQLLVALVATLPVVLLAVVLLQDTNSGRGLTSTVNEITQQSFGLSGNLFNEANAQVTCPHPSTLSGVDEGKLYFDKTCDHKFMVSENGGAWTPLALWNGNSTAIYPINYQTAKVGVGTNNPLKKLQVDGGPLLINVSGNTLASFSASAFPTRDALILNVSSTGNKLASLITNVDQFGLWSNNKSDWAELVVGKVCFNKVGQSSPDCRDSWSTDSYWVINSVGKLENLNKDNVGGGGSINVTGSAEVAGYLLIHGNYVSSDAWKQEDTKNNPQSPSASLCTSTTDDSTCPIRGQNSNEVNRLSDFIAYSPGLLIATGQGGSAMTSTVATQQWKISAPYDTSKSTISSLWAWNDTAVFAINSKTSTSSLLLWQGGNSWTNVSGNIGSATKVGGVGNRLVVPGTSSGGSITVFDISGNGTTLSVSSGTPAGVSLNDSGSVSVDLATAGDTIYVLGTIKFFACIIPASGTACGTRFNNGNNWFGASGTYHINPRAITAVRLSSCTENNNQPCDKIVIIGDSLPSDNQDAKATNSLVCIRDLGVGLNTNSPISCSSISPQIGTTYYNSGPSGNIYSMQDVWMDSTSNRILLSGINKTTSKSFILKSVNGTGTSALWADVTPPLCNPNATPPLAPPYCTTNDQMGYLVSGYGTNYYALQNNRVVFFSGLVTNPGDVKLEKGDLIIDQGDVIVQQNQWGGSSNTSTNTEPSAGISAGLGTGGNPKTCSQGEYIVGLKVSGTGAITGFYCQRL